VGCPSGLRSTIGNRVWLQSYRGFESLSHRMYYVYFLLLANKDIYKGFTEDLKRRFNEHQSGKVTATKHFLPIKLIGYEAYLEKSDAMRREAFMKTTEGRRLFKQQYRDILITEGSSGHPTGRGVE
jgi:putative endonuclease